MNAVSAGLNQAEQDFLSALAVKSIAREFEPEGQLPCPVPHAPALHAQRAAFVTLTRHGQLRGCIGHMNVDTPLYATVAQMARAAAFHDPRFPPLQAIEWPDTAIDISVLSAMIPCLDPASIELGRHGLVLSLGRRSAVFLPQVPVDQGWKLEQYLEALCAKAGLPVHSWCAPDASLQCFETQNFVARDPLEHFNVK